MGFIYWFILYFVSRSKLPWEGSSCEVHVGPLKYWGHAHCYDEGLRNIDGYDESQLVHIGVADPKVARIGDWLHRRNTIMSEMDQLWPAGTAPCVGVPYVQ